MKENVLDVLMYLFENYIIDESGLQKDHDTLTAELSTAGFEHREILKAFDWLQDLSEMCDPEVPPSARTRVTSMRQYTPQEMHKLDNEIRGFLLTLEQTGVLDTKAREVVIDRIMALETEDIDIDQTKWVTMMVLCNQPGREDVSIWMEDVVMNGVQGHLQ